MTRRNYPQKIWMKRIPGRGKSTCKNPEGDVSLACSMSKRKARVTRAGGLTPSQTANK